MSFETRSTEDLVRIAVAGGGFRLDAKIRSTDELVRIAAATKNRGAKVTFTGLKIRPTEDLVRIAIAGDGNITLEE